MNFSVPYSGSLPRWGSMSNEELFRQAKWEPSTCENEFGLLLPTPKAQDGEHPGTSTHKPGQTLHLSAAVIIATSRDHHKVTTQLNTEPERSLNVHLVAAMMGFPQGWTDVSLPTQDLQIGYVHPQSPASVGSVVEKLQRLRSIANKNIANSGQNTKPSEDNTNNS
ncbi:MAG: hypothetical protein V7L05_20020 [Nostoc sp.]|uniref:hypothetical protein n=1 Tax=Nostoc sp. TaxID=1180 RepID=UPI002FF8AB36